MNNKTLIYSVWISSFIILSATILSYAIKFSDYGASNNPETWAHFGDFFGGILNPFISLINLAVLTYLSIRLVSIDDERNQWTLQELARPYGEIEFSKNLNQVKIELKNLGLGPMILKNITITDNAGNTFGNFRKLIEELEFNNPGYLTGNGIPVRSFSVVGNHAVVGKERKVVLLKVLASDGNYSHERFLSFLIKELPKYTIVVSYQDMYKRDMEILSERIVFENSN